MIQISCVSRGFWINFERAKGQSKEIINIIFGSYFNSQTYESIQDRFYYLTLNIILTFIIGMWRMFRMLFSYFS